MPSSPAAHAYRPDIDGLRAVAVLAVVIFHAFPTAVPGGFVGVDVFFVISGFLISGILRRSVDQQRFSLWAFYGRRIRRILPALCAVLVACLLAGYAVWLRDEWKDLGRQTFAGALFHANVFFAGRSEVGYFVALGDRVPLLHLWSLGVEEQFYLVWPLVFVAVLRWSRRPAAVVAALLAVSFVINLAWVSSAPTAAYFLPFSRLWELLVGAMLALSGRPLGRGWDSVAGWSGLGLIVTACLVIDSATTFPGWWALLPTLGAALVMAAGPTAMPNRVILSARPMVWVGLISYPLYLWHWPLLVFGRAVWIDARFWPGTLALVAVSVLLAWATYRHLEQRVRSGRGAVTPVALLVAVVVIALAGRMIADGRIESRLNRMVPQAAELIRATSDWTYPYPVNFRKTSDFAAGEENAGRPRAVLFVGDSYLEQYWPRIHVAAAATPDQAPTVRFMTRGGCAPLRHRESRGDLCERFLDAALAAADDPAVQTVVFGGFWESYFRTGRVGEAAVRPLIPLDGPVADQVMSAFGDMVRRLRASGKHVFVILTSPTDPAFSPRFLVSRLTGRLLTAPVPIARWRAQVSPVLDQLSLTARAAGAVVLDPVPWVCDGETCPVVGPDGESTHVDRGHMRPWFILERATFIDQVLQDPGRR